MCSPNSTTQRFTMRNSQVFRGVPTWHPIFLAPDDEKLRAYRDPAVRKKLHEEVVEWKVDIPGGTLAGSGMTTCGSMSLSWPKNKHFKGKSMRELAEAQGKGIIDAFLDLVVEEKLDTVFLLGENNVDTEAVATILNYPNAIVGLSDGGAHVQFHGGYGYSTRLFGYWVREQGIMSLEQAVKRLTFESASAFGIYDRGLLRPGMVADITIFDPDTIDRCQRTWCMISRLVGGVSGSSRLAFTTPSSMARYSWRTAATPGRCQDVCSGTRSITPMPNLSADKAGDSASRPYPKLWLEAQGACVNERLQGLCRVFYCGA